MARHAPYATKTPEANDASTAHTSTTESLTGESLNFRFLPFRIRMGCGPRTRIHSYKNSMEEKDHSEKIPGYSIA